MDAAIVNSCVESIVTILETYSVGDIKAIKPYLKKGAAIRGDIAGIMKLGGEFNGSVAVTFTAECILGIVSNMFGEEMTEMNDEIKDAVGEMVNMMAGQVNTKMTEMQKKLKASFDTVYLGKDHPVSHIEGRPVIAMPYKSTAGRFGLEVCFEK
ncbi:MAG: chemotaxis protein CheX [Proteobacteria bacterium]|nr:chemotaxis protein CheX [Pseudomonadota bacterium]